MNDAAARAIVTEEVVKIVADNPRFGEGRETLAKLTGELVDIIIRAYLLVLAAEDEPKGTIQ